MKIPKIPQQIIRLSVIFVLIIAALIAARIILIPTSFGKYGHYRADAVGEIMNQEISYAGHQICVECHDDIYNLKARSNHQNLSCEVCHGPAAEHVEAPDEVTPIIPKSREMCAICHNYNPSRPTGFPQIILLQHNPGKACRNCHDPHRPVIPQTPQECSACHREIAMTKNVSHHVSLPCQKCHVVPVEHLKDPRTAAAHKPEKREFCGGCHATDADSSRDIPRINLENHNRQYKCWDCHYPHHPEAY